MSNHALAKLYFIAVSLYCLSLITPGFSALSMNNSIWGVAILFLGWSQTLLALTVFINDFDINSLLLIMPWCANLFILMSFILLRKCTNERMSYWSAHLGVLCTMAFLFNPKVFVGETMKLTEVNIGIGGLLWCTSSIVILFLFYQLKRVGAFISVNKQKKTS